MLQDAPSIRTCMHISIHLRLGSWIQIQVQPSSGFCILHWLEVASLLQPSDLPCSGSDSRLSPTRTVALNSALLCWWLSGVQGSHAC